MVIKESPESHVFITVTKRNWGGEGGGLTLAHGPEEAVYYGREGMVAAAVQGCGGENLLISGHIRVQRKENALSCLLLLKPFLFSLEFWYVEWYYRHLG